MTEPVDGAWVTGPTEGVIDWQDPGQVTIDPYKTTDYEDIRPHHEELNPVHAAHLPTGELILFHGMGEQRIWPIGAGNANIRWHPLPYEVPPNLCSHPGLVIPNGRCFASIFCAGHVVLPDGRFFVAGGDVDGTPDGGGLIDTFTYDPWRGAASLFGPFDFDEKPPFGWRKHTDMYVDRWYPTLTVLPDGRVLISSGASRLPLSQGQNTFEVFDPTVGPLGSMTPLAIAGTSPFSDSEPIPWYPFMFVLPNGDIFYAGGEGASAVTSRGRVLVPDYNNNGTWKWSSRVFASTINGGSAVMYQPGKIMKSGGLRTSESSFGDIAHAKTETIDLSQYESDDYAAAPNFYTNASMDMNEPRHYHTLTLLPDGRVLATGGNTRSNSELGDRIEHPCEFPEGVPIGDGSCSATVVDGVPDDPANADEGCPAVPSRCSEYDPDGDGPLDEGYYCPFLGPDWPCEDGNGMPDALLCGTPCNANSECPPGSTCANDHCQMPCPGTPNNTCAAVVHCTLGKQYCDPANNECHATKSAEIWDPTCGVWTELDEQEKSRMYHSTALLLPDRTVISMGGGHMRFPLVDQYNAEIFEPEYGQPGTESAPTISVVGETNMYFDKPALPYGQTAQVMFDNGSATVTADRFTLVRLGSVTHAFDMDQRFMELAVAGNLIAPGPLTVAGPQGTAWGPAEAHAPPGYYMLFLKTLTGEVSTGHYVKVGAFQSMVYACPATPSLVATETSCTLEPVGGLCPAGGEQVDAVDLPRVDSPGGPVDGWHVLVPAGEIDDPLAPTSEEQAALNARCVAACEAHWSSNPAVAANCDDPTAFDSPQHFYDNAAGPYDLILPGQKNGAGVFPSQSLMCDLDSTCCTAFDEELCATVPDRTTAANDLLGVGEEYKVALGSLSTIKIVTAQGTYTSGLTGSTGYSFCRDGNVNGPCPFYLGSFEALATSAITASLTCADNTTERKRISNLVVKLSQPAFGIAEQGTTGKGFPKGALIFESAFDVDGQHMTFRRPSSSNALMNVSGSTFNATDMTLTLVVPCNTSTAEISVKLTARDPGSTTTPLGKPPVVTNTTAATGSCGALRALGATVSDPDGDAGSVRWRVDGVLMAAGTTAMVVSGAHQVDAVVRDGRGATTTATKVVSCI